MTIKDYKMTYVGPYSMATDFNDYYLDPPKAVEVATPGTLLDVIAKRFPNFLELIKTANLEPLYNSVGYKKYTVFVPSVAFPHLDPDIAFRVCKNSTGNGALNLSTLRSSQMYILESLSPQNNLPIETCGDTTTVRGKKIILADIMCTNGIIHVIRGVIWPNY